MQIRTQKRSKRSRSKHNSNRKKQSKQIDINKFVQKAVVNEREGVRSFREIKDLPIHQSLKENILSKGYKSLTEIQDRTFESISSGKDILGVASTGTGKTAAFLIPKINEILNNRDSGTTLIMVPTRELALQINEELMSLTLKLKIFSTTLIGGTSRSQDIIRLQNKNHFIIGTPGRVGDLLKQKKLNSNKITSVILDEFDRMLDMGFKEDVMSIYNSMSNNKQTLLFSATVDNSQRELIDSLLDDPEYIKVLSSNKSSQNVDQDIILTNPNKTKIQTLVDLLQEEKRNKVIVFAETKRTVSNLYKKIKVAGFKVNEIHGNRSQPQRKNALDSFKKSKNGILIATDVACRGIDVDNINLVVNYQIPRDWESYIHRIGRTGRAGKSGRALTFVN